MSPRLLLLCLLVGCAVEPAEPDPTPQPTPEGIAVGPTVGTLQLPFSADVQGTADAPVGAFDLLDGAGTIEVEGQTLDAVAYQSIPWGGFGLTLVQGLALGADELVVFWVYCDEDGGVDGVYVEGSHGLPLTWSPGDGVCLVQDEPSTTPIELPAFGFDDPSPETTHWVDGEDLVVQDDGTGFLVDGAVAMDLWVFEVVDCSDCGGNGWTELHGLAWDPARGELCFVIAYLNPDAAGQVQLSYSLSLPSLIDPWGNVWVEAEWGAVE
jgi:hypothetical protein